ncbi:MAG: hypothetical protein V2I33_07205, partial [Kangiellaceae bacterium]|nr:hypothetical protein [Kangiellaceae bacterium]
MLSLNLAWKLFWRDWKSGELRVLMFALWIAIGGLTAVTALVDRIDRGMTKEAAQVLGADLVMSSPRAMDSTYQQKAEELNLATSETLRFSTVVVAGGEFNLSTIKATDSKFPLAGTLAVGKALFSEGEPTTGAPPSGEVWMSGRLFQLLKVAIGDTVQIGVSDFKVT